MQNQVRSSRPRANPSPTRLDPSLRGRFNMIQPITLIPSGQDCSQMVYGRAHSRSSDEKASLEPSRIFSRPEFHHVFNQRGPPVIQHRSFKASPEKLCSWRWGDSPPPPLQIHKTVVLCNWGSLPPLHKTSVLCGWKGRPGKTL